MFEKLHKLNGRTGVNDHYLLYLLPHANQNIRSFARSLICNYTVDRSANARTAIYASNPAASCGCAVQCSMKLEIDCAGAWAAARFCLKVTGDLDAPVQLDTARC